MNDAACRGLSDVFFRLLLNDLKQESVAKQWHAKSAIHVKFRLLAKISPAIIMNTVSGVANLKSNGTWLVFT